MKILISFISAVMFSSPTFAFKWKDCRQQASSVANRFTTKSGGDSNPVSAFIFNTMCQSSTSTSTSTSGFTTSTSKCGMFAMKEEREEFLRANLYNVKMDIAKGHGEYLNSLAALSGCEDDTSVSIFGGKLRANFKRIFSEGTGDQIAPMTLQIDQLIQEDNVLVKSCAHNV